MRDGLDYGAGMKIAGIVIAIALALYLGISAYAVIIAMKIPRIPLRDSPASLGLVYEDISFSSRVDSVPLEGWYIPGERNFAIIVVNGGWRNRVDPNIGSLELARDLVESRYSVLLFDLRGRGESGGEGLTLTYVERDIGGAVDYIMSTGCPSESIGIIGFSSGAVSSLIFASQEPVGVLVLDGCFADVDNMIVREATKRGVPEFLVRSFIPGVFLMAKIIYGYTAANPVDRVRDVTCPIFFIHGAIDRSVPLTDVQKLYHAGSNLSNRLWVVAGADHTQAYRTNPTGYVEKVTSFFGSLP